MSTTCGWLCCCGQHHGHSVQWRSMLRGKGVPGRLPLRHVTFTLRVRYWIAASSGLSRRLNYLYDRTSHRLKMFSSTRIFLQLIDNRRINVSGKTRCPLVCCCCCCWYECCRRSLSSSPVTGCRQFVDSSYCPTQSVSLSFFVQRQPDFNHVSDYIQYFAPSHDPQNTSNLCSRLTKTTGLNF